jgi:hypothetical protein
VRNGASFEFHFEKSGLSPDEGAIDPAAEHFEGGKAGQAAVRETGQNSIDARRPGHMGPVRMEFELAMVPTSSIPDIEGLRSHLREVVAYTSGQMGNDRMVSALEMAEQSEIPVLRISDFGTTGLVGSESGSSPGSPLSRLTRGSGNSENDGVRGGSFGIGSAAGRVASAMSTVLYRSLPDDGRDGETVLAGFSRLATHLYEGERRRASGILTRRGGTDFEYRRPAPPVPPFTDRTEPGTDIFVLGYRMAEEDPSLHRLRDAALEHFMVAIARGKLEVRGVAAGAEWVLDAMTVGTAAKRDPKHAAFYAALQDPQPDVAELESLGRVELYVNIDDSLQTSLHTVTMRSPLMRIAQFKFNSVRAKYAAIVICADERGNALLRRLEPPQHDAWDPERSPQEGRAAIKELKAFIGDRLRARVSATLGETVEIKGLERFLPVLDVGPDAAGEDSGRPKSGEPPTDDESSQVTGSTAPIAVRPVRHRTVRPAIVRPAIGGEDGEDITKGRDRGGGGKRRSRGVGVPGTGQEGDGRSRIRSGEVQFRSWSTGQVDGASRAIRLALTAGMDLEGDLALVPLGPGGVPDADFDLGIRSVRTLAGQELEHEGNVLRRLRLNAGETLRIDVVVPAALRYRLGVG